MRKMKGDAEYSGFPRIFILFIIAIVVVVLFMIVFAIGKWFPNGLGK